MDKEIKNPKTGNKIKVRTALQLPGDHPANKMAKKLVAKSPIKKDKTGDDVGGPAYPNVPKGAKTSKDAKKMKKKKKSLGTSIASKFQKQIDKYNKARKQTPKGLNQQGLKVMTKKYVYKSVVNTLNSIHKRLNN